MSNTRPSLSQPPFGDKRPSKLGKSHVEGPVNGTMARPDPMAKSSQPVPMPQAKVIAPKTRRGLPNDLGSRSIESLPASDPSSFHYFPNSSRPGHTGSGNRFNFPGSKSKTPIRVTDRNVNGIWRDGTVHWEAGRLEQPPHPTSVHDSLLNAADNPAIAIYGGKTECRTEHRKEAPRTANPRLSRPSIQLVIPPGRSRRPLPSLTECDQPFAASAAKPAPTGSVTQPTSSSGISNAVPTRLYPVDAPNRTQIDTLVASASLHGLSEQTHLSSPRSSFEEDVSLDDDDKSVYSQPSSISSVDMEPVNSIQTVQPLNTRCPTASETSLTARLESAGRFEDEISFAHGFRYAQPSTKQPPMPISPPQPGDDPGYSPVASSSLLSGTVSPLSPVVRKIRRKEVPSAISRPPVTYAAFATFSKSPPSPTWSQAEQELEIHLSAIDEDQPFQWDHIILHELGGNTMPPKAPPRRSSRRVSHQLHLAESLRSQHADEQPEPRPNLDVHTQAPSRTTMDKPPVRGQHEHRTALTASLLQEKMAQRQRNLSPSSAETIIKNIMEQLDDLDDLFAVALTNKGFYSAFKRHEMDLMRTVLWNQSPAAWEYLETLPPSLSPSETSQEDPTAPISGSQNGESELDTAIPRPEHTPASYFCFFTRDSYIIAALKLLILERCQTMLRSSTVAALSNPHPSDKSAVQSARAIDDAFWRIWTFCRIFGRNRGRENDLIAQLDWLKGGKLAHQETCTSTLDSKNSFNFSPMLVSATKSFGRGNVSRLKQKGEGLSAEELYNILEIWTSLGVMLHGLHGRTEQAREHGVFDATDIRGGDVDGEEMMLEEYQYHILTLGLSPLFTLATCPPAPSAQAFAIAKTKGWTHWRPPREGCSRSTFLKEPVSRLYEEKIQTIITPVDDSRRMMEEMRRIRYKNFAAELRERKRSMSTPEVALRASTPVSPEPKVDNVCTMGEWDSILGSLPTTSSPPHSTRSPPGPPAYRASSADYTMCYPSTPSLQGPPSLASLSHSLSHTSRGPPSPQTPPNSHIHPAFRPGGPNPLPITTFFPQLDEGDLHFSPTCARPLVPPPPPFSSALSAPQMVHRPSTAKPPLRPSTWAAPPAPASQHPMQLAMAPDVDPTMNSADRAIFRIVEMGFTPEDAKYALKKTDLGDGLRLDRAVELLLREGGQAW